MSLLNKKFYLGFLFDSLKTDALHCTHCYFGTKNLREIDLITKTVDRFFDHHDHRIRMPVIHFNWPTYFGPESNIRVLLTQNVAAFDVFWPLRKAFQDAELLQTAMPFRPHVTTPKLEKLAQPFTHYALVRSGEIINWWPVYAR